LAGADMLLICHGVDKILPRIYGGLMEAFESKKLTRKRIEQSVIKIVRLKIQKDINSIPYQTKVALPRELEIIQEYHNDQTQKRGKFRRTLPDEKALIEKLAQLGTKTIYHGTAARTKNYPQWQLYTDSGAPELKNKNPRRLKDIGGDGNLVILHTQMQNFKYFLRKNISSIKNRTVLVFTTEHPFPNSFYKSFLRPNHVLISSFSNVAASRKALINIYLSGVLPPQATLDLDL